MGLLGSPDPRGLFGWKNRARFARLFHQCRFPKTNDDNDISDIDNDVNNNNDNNTKLLSLGTCKRKITSNTVTENKQNNLKVNN